jgi:hypothetical protein
VSAYDLHERIAKCLGWTVSEVQSFSLAAVRDLVRGKDDALHAEISTVIQRGLHITQPIRDPRRVPMPDMSWLGDPPPKTKR